MKKSILFIIPNTFYAGGEKVFEQIINRIDTGKFNLFLACSKHPVLLEKTAKKAKYFYIPFEKQINFKIFSQLIKIIKQNNIQIVHTQGSRGNFYGRIAAKIAKIPHIISTVAMLSEGYDVNLLKKLIYVILDKFTEFLVDKFTVCSNALKNRLIKLHFINEAKVKVISNGINLEEYKDSSENKKLTYQEFNIQPNTVLVGTVCRLVWQKGLPHLLEAIKLIIKKTVNQKIKFLIVGEGPEKTRLQELAAKLGISDHIIFSNFRTDIPKILTSLDLFVLPSIKEGQPIALMEAMAATIPIITTNIEGNNEVIENNVTGILVPPADTVSLANAIHNTLNNKNKSLDLANNARKYAEKNFNEIKIVKQYEKIYMVS